MGASVPWARLTTKRSEMNVNFFLPPNSRDPARPWFGAAARLPTFPGRHPSAFPEVPAVTFSTCQLLILLVVPLICKSHCLGTRDPGLNIKPFLPLPGFVRTLRFCPEHSGKGAWLLAT